MSWHRVVIKNSDRAMADIAAQDLIADFKQKKRESGMIEGVSVYIRLNDSGDRLYYFSPQAAEIGRDILREFSSEPCLESPDLTGFKEVAD